MRNNLLIPALGAALLLAGCAGPASLRQDFGKSYSINTTTQFMDPTAEGRDRPTANVDGQKAEKGLARYRADRPDTSRDKLVQDISN